MEPLENKKKDLKRLINATKNLFELGTCLINNINEITGMSIDPNDGRTTNSDEVR